MPIDFNIFSKLNQKENTFKLLFAKRRQIKIDIDNIKEYINRYQYLTNSFNMLESLLERRQNKKQSKVEQLKTNCFVLSGVLNIIGAGATIYYGFGIIFFLAVFISSAAISAAIHQFRILSINSYYDNDIERLQQTVKEKEPLIEEETIANSIAKIVYYDLIDIKNQTEIELYDLWQEIDALNETQKQINDYNHFVHMLNLLEERLAELKTSTPEVSSFIDINHIKEAAAGLSNTKG